MQRLETIVLQLVFGLCLKTHRLERAEVYIFGEDILRVQVIGGSFIKLVYWDFEVFQTDESGFWLYEIGRCILPNHGLHDRCLQVLGISLDWPWKGSVNTPNSVLLHGHLIINRIRWYHTKKRISNVLFNCVHPCLDHHLRPTLWTGCVILFWIHCHSGIKSSIKWKSKFVKRRSLGQRRLYKLDRLHRSCPVSKRFHSAR